MVTTGLPPGPRLPRAVQAGLMLRLGPRFIDACKRRYGPTFTLRVAGMGTLVYLTDPADIKTVFAGDPRIYHAGEANSMLKGLLGDTSVLVVDGDAHRDRRRVMLAPFTRDAVAGQTGLMAQIAADNIARWPVGRPFAAAPKMAQITLEIILRTVIGASDPARLTALREVMPRVLRVGAWETLALANEALLGKSSWRTLREAIDAADGLLYAEIADRRADPDLMTRTDALSILVRTAGPRCWPGRCVRRARGRTTTSTPSPGRRCASARWCSTSAAC